MATQMVPIDPEKRDDLYYRYKMPAVQTKVEGSGNGIKTVIPNIHDICIAIKRPEEILMRFFQFELGAQRNVSAKDDKFLLMGSHTTERMQDKIYDFIRKLVLCKHCRNPETSVELDANKRNVVSISMVCDACGKRSKFDDHRVLSVMAQYYQKHPEEARSAKSTAHGHHQQKSAAETEAAQPSTAAPAAPVKGTAIAKSDLKDNRPNPTIFFARDMEECGDNIDELISRVVRLMIQYNLTEVYGPPLIINSMIQEHSSDLLSTMRRYAQLLRRFSTVPELYNHIDTHDEKELTELLRREKAIQKTFLRECQRICAKEYDADKLPVIIFFLFTEGILRDTCIVSWALDSRPLKLLNNPDLDAEMKRKVMPIVDWLGVPVAVEEADD